MIRLEKVTKEFKNKDKTVKAVDDVSIHIEKGEIFGIIGFSGAGKSTLVRLINALELPTKGKVYFKNQVVNELSETKLRQVRRNIGMIFQGFNLLSQRTVLRNVTYPLEIAGVGKKEAIKRAKELLELVGLADKEKAYPSKLSGGQKQRVAIARALATNPEVLLCDEATSALDPITTRQILDLLKEINEKLKVTIVIITHEMKVVEQICDKVAVMSDGQVKETGLVKEVFLNPQSDIAKQLIIPNPSAKEVSEIKSIRIAFDGQSSFEPVISSLTLECNTLINILGANTENIGGKAYGQILIEYPRNEEEAKNIFAYLDNKRINYSRTGND